MRGSEFRLGRSTRNMLVVEGKQKGQKGQVEAKRFFLPLLALFALFASLQPLTCFWRRALSGIHSPSFLTSSQIPNLKSHNHLATRAPPPFIIFSTSASVAIELPPGVVIANAPCAAPYSTASWAPWPVRNPYINPDANESPPPTRSKISRFSRNLA